MQQCSGVAGLRPRLLLLRSSRPARAAPPGGLAGARRCRKAEASVVICARLTARPGAPRSAAAAARSDTVGGGASGAAASLPPPPPPPPPHSAAIGVVGGGRIAAAAAAAPRADALRAWRRRIVAASAAAGADAGGGGSGGGSGDAAQQQQQQHDEAYYEALSDADLKRVSYERYAARRKRRIEERDAARLTEEERARRAKIGEANKGRVPWNKGRRHSPGAQLLRARTCFLCGLGGGRLCCCTGLICRLAVQAS